RRERAGRRQGPGKRGGRRLVHAPPLIESRPVRASGAAMYDRAACVTTCAYLAFSPVPDELLPPELPPELMPPELAPPLGLPPAPAPLPEVPDPLPAPEPPAPAAEPSTPSALNVSSSRRPVTLSFSFCWN